MAKMTTASRRRQRASVPDVEFLRLWTTADPVTVHATPILSMGFTEGAPTKSAARGEQVQLNRLAHVAVPESKQATRRAVFTDELPAIDPTSTPPVDRVKTNRAQCWRAGGYGPRMSREDNEKAAKMIEELSKGFLRPSRSPWDADVPQAGRNQPRMVIDYRPINKDITRFLYPMPRADELFDFFKIDPRTGRSAWRREEDRVHLAPGHFEWLVDGRLHFSRCTLAEQHAVRAVSLHLRLRTSPSGLLDLRAEAVLQRRGWSVHRLHPRVLRRQA